MSDLRLFPLTQKTSTVSSLVTWSHVLTVCDVRDVCSILCLRWGVPGYRGREGRGVEGSTNYHTPASTKLLLYYYSTIV